MMTFIGVSCFFLNVFLSYRIWVASLKEWCAVPLVILALSGAGGGGACRPARLASSSLAGR